LRLLHLVAGFVVTLVPSGDAARTDRDAAGGPGDVLDASPWRDGRRTMQRVWRWAAPNAKRGIRWAVSAATHSADRGLHTADRRGVNVATGKAVLELIGTVTSAVEGRAMAGESPVAFPLAEIGLVVLERVVRGTPLPVLC
jgi:hypothetical protein